MQDFWRNPAVVVVLTIIGIIVLRFLVALALSGGDVRRIGVVIRAAWRVLRDGAFAEQVRRLMEPAPKPEGPPKLSGVPLRLLALLQREGRLLDFLLEDIQAYPDPQIGAAVRDIHRKCQDALKEHLILEPVIRQPEDSSVEVPRGFDPSAIRLTGNVTGEPPFRGTLRHHGWRVTDFKLAPPPEGQDELVIMPAEVELP